MIASVIKVEVEKIILQFDENDQTIEIPIERFGVDVENGQIFDINENGNIIFLEDETRIRRERVATLLSQIKRD